MSTRHARPAWQMPPGLPQAADETWTYILNDGGVTYGPGWWPFYADRTSPHATRSTDRAPQPCGVWLEPDLAFSAWHTEYLLLYPTDETGVVGGSCYVVPDDTPGPDACLTDFRRRRRLGGRAGRPGHPRPGHLAEKMRRASDFLRAAIAERDAEADRPTTAAEQEAATTSQ